jgi:hypothetical protein
MAKGGRPTWARKARKRRACTAVYSGKVTKAPGFLAAAVEDGRLIG